MARISTEEPTFILPTDEEGQQEEDGMYQIKRTDTEVDLTRCRQQCIPECLQQLTQLKTLTMRWNQMNKIDACANKLNANTLTYIDLYDNQVYNDSSVTYICHLPGLFFSI